MFTYEQWQVERARLEAAQGEIQTAIDNIEASYSSGGVVWNRTGVVNNPTFSSGDLTVAATAAHVMRSTVSPTLSKRSFKVQITERGNSGYLAIGAIRDDQSIASPPTSLAAVPAGMWLWRSDSYKANNGSSAMVGAGWETGDVIEALWDASGNLWFKRNGASIQGDPVAGTNPVFTGLTGNIGACLCFMGANGSPAATGVFAGYTPDTGFALLGGE